MVKKFLAIDETGKLYGVSGVLIDSLYKLETTISTEAQATGTSPFAEVDLSICIGSGTSRSVIGFVNGTEVSVGLVPSSSEATSVMDIFIDTTTGYAYWNGSAFENKSLLNYDLAKNDYIRLFFLSGTGGSVNRTPETYDGYVFQTALYIGSEPGAGSLRSIYGGDDNNIVFALGYWDANDGGGGFFRWYNGGGTDDGALCIVYNGRVGDAGPCWLRIQPEAGSFDAHWFEKTETDDAAAINAALAEAQATNTSLVRIPADFDDSASIPTVELLAGKTRHIIDYRLHQTVDRFGCAIEWIDARSDDGYYTSEKLFRGTQNPTVIVDSKSDGYATGYPYPNKMASYCWASNGDVYIQLLSDTIAKGEPDLSLLFYPTGATAGQSVTVYHALLDGYNIPRIDLSPTNLITTTPTITDATAENPVIITLSAEHGVSADRFPVTIADGTEDGYTVSSVINGTWIAQVVDASRLSLVSCDGTGMGTYDTDSATITITTNSHRATLNVPAKSCDVGDEWKTEAIYSEGIINTQGLLALNAVHDPFATGQVGLHSTGRVRVFIDGYARTGLTDRDSNITVNNITSLRALSGDNGINVSASITGYTNLGDGGAGNFRWDSDGGTDDGGLTIVYGGTIGSTGPCWRRDVDSIINVKSFGATGDGTTDDSAAIKLACDAVTTLAAATNKNTTLFFPKGTYLIATPTLDSNKTFFRPASNVTYLGESGAIIQVASGLNQLDYRVFYTTSDVSNIIFRSLTIDGYSSSGQSGPIYHNFMIGLIGGANENVTLDNCKFQNHTGTNPVLIGDYTSANMGSNISVTKCTFENIGNDTTLTDHVSLWIQATNVDVRGNYFINAVTEPTCRDYGSAIELHVTHANISDNIFQNKAVGVLLAAGYNGETKNVNITNNTFKLTANAIFLIQDWPGNIENAILSDIIVANNNVRSAQTVSGQPISFINSYISGSGKRGIERLLVENNIAIFERDLYLVPAGTSPPTVALTGTVPDGYDIQIEITTEGTVGNAIFRWSSDGGSTWEAESITTDFTVDLTDNISLEFEAGTYFTDNVYTNAPVAGSQAISIVGNVSSMMIQNNRFENYSSGAAVITPVIYDGYIKLTDTRIIQNQFVDCGIDRGKSIYIVADDANGPAQRLEVRYNTIVSTTDPITTGIHIIASGSGIKTGENFYHNITTPSLVVAGTYGLENYETSEYSHNFRSELLNAVGSFVGETRLVANSLVQDDMAGGTWSWSDDAVSAHNGDTIYVPTQTVRTGCWKRQNVTNGDVLFVADVDGYDDIPALEALMASCAYQNKIIFSPVRPFHFDTTTVIPSGTNILVKSGCEIVQGLTYLNTAFNAGFLSYPTVSGINGTLAANVTVGSRTFTSNALYDVDDWVSIDTGQHIQYFKIVNRSGGAPYTYTVNKEIKEAWLSGDDVIGWNGVPLDITIEFEKGAFISGTGDRFVEVYGAQNCIFKGINCSSSTDGYLGATGVCIKVEAAYQTQINDCHTNSKDGTILGGIILRSCEDSQMNSCSAEQTGTYGLAILDCWDCTNTLGIANGTTYGACIYSLQTVGSHDCCIINGSYWNCTYGVMSGKSFRSKIVGVDSSYNSYSGIHEFNGDYDATVSDCSCSNNTFAGLFVGGPATDATVYGFRANNIAAVANGTRDIWIDSSCSLSNIKVSLGSSQGIYVSSGTVFMQNLELIDPNSSGTTVIWVNSGTFNLNSASLSFGAATHGIYIAAGATVNLRDTQILGTVTNGITVQPFGFLNAGYDCALQKVNAVSGSKYYRKDSLWTAFISGKEFATTAPSTSTITMNTDCTEFIKNNSAIRVLDRSGYIDKNGSSAITGVAITGITNSILDSGGRIYIKPVDDGDGYYHFDIHNRESCVSGNKIGHTASVNPPSGSNAVTADNGSGLGGTITITGATPAITVTGISYYKWYIVDAITSSLLTLNGPPLSTTSGNILELWYGPNDKIQPLNIAVPGYYARDAETSTKLEDFLKQYLPWTGAIGHAAWFKVTCNSYSGTTHYVNLMIGGNAISTTNSNDGLQIAGSGTGNWVETTIDINPTSARIEPQDLIEIFVTQGATVDPLDSDLTLSGAIVLE